MGGSTNAVVHLLALAGRVGVPLELDDFDRLSNGIPLLVDLQPSGRYLMEDFHYAGGLPAALKQIGDKLSLDMPDSIGSNARPDRLRRGMLQPRGHPRPRQSRARGVRHLGAPRSLCPSGATR